MNHHHEKNIRFLGMGPHAIIRPGIVLIAPPNEYHHFYRQSAIFVYAMGEDESYNNTHVIRGVIIDHPTPFTVSEMIDTNTVNLLQPPTPLGPAANTANVTAASSCGQCPHSFNT